MQQNAFDAALGRLSSLLGGGDEPEAAPSNAMAAARPQKQVAFRASMLPIGNYDDGSVAFPVWPQGAVDAYNAMGRFHRGEAPQPEDAVLAGLAMTGGLGGLARGAGNAMARAGRAGPRLNAPEGYYELYHGTAAPEQFEALSLAKRRNRYEPGVFFTDKPEVASNYARTAENLPDGGRVFRTYLPKDDVLDYDLGKLRAYDPVLDAMGDADIANKRAIRFMGKNGENTFMVLSPSKLKYQDEIARATPTNEAPTLFANPKEAASAGALSAGSSTESTEHHSRSQPRGEGGRFVGSDSFDGRMAALDKMLVDLDGDGVPDASVPVPQLEGNAMRIARASENYAPPPSQHLAPMMPGYELPQSPYYLEDMMLDTENELRQRQGKPPRKGPPFNVTPPANYPFRGNLISGR